MLEFYFTDPRTLGRLHASPHGSRLVAFAAHLAQCGYAGVTGRNHIRSASYLCSWLTDNALDLSAITEELLDIFVEALRCRPQGSDESRHAHVPSGVARFLAWLRSEGTAGPATLSEPDLPVLIGRFESWIQQHRGVTIGTVCVYRGLLLEFIDVLGDDPSHYDAVGIRAFVFRLSQRTGRSYTKLGVTAVRMFLHFLAVVGHCDPKLVDAAPTMAHWKKAHLPARLPQADVERLIDACDPKSPYGCRNRAMLLLMARLGLRSGDVAALCIQDIDWRNGRLMVRGKNRRLGTLPLPQDAGDAVLAYLTHGRPGTSIDRVFLTFTAPVRVLLPGSVGAMVARQASKAGVKLPRAGSHVLRHTLASSLLDDGMTLPGISVLLRHANLETTQIYAKVDLGLLDTVVRPWPLAVTP